MYYLTAKVIFEPSKKKSKTFFNKIEKNKCRHEDSSYSGRTDRVFEKEDQFIHAGIIEPYKANLIQEEKSYMLFTLKPDGFDSLPNELEVDTHLVCGVGRIEAKGSEFITGRKSKSAKQTDSDDKRFGKIYCYKHHTYHKSVDTTSYSLFRFPFQELSHIYKTIDDETIKLKIEKVINNLSVPQEERIFFKYQSHLAPGTLILKYIEILYDQIVFLKYDQVLSEKLENVTEELGLHFCDHEAIAFLDRSIALLRKNMKNLYYPSAWALINYLGIEPKDELLKSLKPKHRFDTEILKSKEIDPKYFNYVQGRFIFEYLIKYPLQQEHYAKILSQLSITINSRKKSQTIDYIHLDDFSMKEQIEKIIDNPYELFEMYNSGNEVPLLFDDIDWGEKSRLSSKFEPLNPYRLRAIVVDYIKKQENSSGDVWVSFEDAQEYILYKLHYLDKSVINNFEQASIDNLLKNKAFLNCFEIDLNRRHLTTKKLAKQEQFINNTIAPMLEKRQLHDTSMLHKMEALDFVFVSGVAGAGKSYGLCQYLNGVCGLKKFQVVSPTGKSANVLRNKIDSIKEFSLLKNHLSDNVKEISTAHQFLVDQDFWNHELFSLYEPKNIQEKELDILVIDEISMFTLDLLYFVFKATKAKKIILLGDIKQLQPIGYGSVANGMYNYLKTNDFSNLVELKESRRAKAGAKFIDMSLLLREKKIDNKALQEYLEIKDDTLETHYFHSFSDLSKIFKEIFLDALGKNSFAQNILKLGNIKAVDSLQIISPNNVGEFGTYALNNFIKSQLGDEYKYNKKYKGLKYIKLTNDNKTGVVNGMFGVADDTNTIYFENGINEKYSYETHNLGYVISIHKSQGSGFENVILVIPEHENGNITKELIYTALTRASKKLYILIHEKQKALFESLVCQKQRKMNIFETDKKFWDKQADFSPFYYQIMRQYRTKQDLYMGLLLERCVDNIDPYDIRYDFNGAFYLEKNGPRFNIANYIESKKVKIGDTEITEECRSIDVRQILQEYNLSHEFIDKANEMVEDFMVLNREEKLKYDYIPPTQKIIITTHNGLRVRSWSEAIIMLILDYFQINYSYEEKLNNSLLPDFMLKDKKIVIEHLGMLNDDEYKQHWESKKSLYKSLGYNVISIGNIEKLPNSNVCITTSEKDLVDLNTLIDKFSIFKL